MPSAEHRLAAILSADVVGYSRLMAEDEDATVQAVTVRREEVELHVRQHRGRLVDFNIRRVARSATSTQVCTPLESSPFRTLARETAGLS